MKNKTPNHDPTIGCSHETHVSCNDIGRLNSKRRRKDIPSAINLKTPGVTTLNSDKVAKEIAGDEDGNCIIALGSVLWGDMAILHACGPDGKA